MMYKIKLNRKETENIIYVLNYYLHGGILSITDDEKFKSIRARLLVTTTPIKKIYDFTLSEDEAYLIWVSIKTLIDDNLVSDVDRITAIIPIMSLFAMFLDHIHQENKDELPVS